MNEKDFIEEFKKITEETKSKTDWRKVKQEFREEKIESFFKEKLYDARFQGIAIGVQTLSRVLLDIVNKTDVTDAEKLEKIKSYLKTEIESSES